jgi:hypothetical protein
LIVAKGKAQDSIRKPQISQSFHTQQAQGIFNSSLSAIIRTGKGPAAFVKERLLCLADSPEIVENILDQDPTYPDIMLWDAVKTDKESTCAMISVDKQK